MSQQVVTKHSPILVTPAGPTPSGELLSLSDNDHSPFVWSHVEVIIVFDRAVGATEVLKEALAKALVSYYPVAGRIGSVLDGGELGVECNDEGVWFVAAEAECKLEDVDYLSIEPLMIPKEELLPSAPGDVVEISLPFLMQVTEFKCGGFALGFKFHHAIFDGKGVGQFITAIAELSRGLPNPTITPIWSRNIIKNPPSNFPRRTSLPSITPPPSEDTSLVFRAIDIPLESIDAQKTKFLTETGRKCTAFDVVIAKMWQSRIRAIELKSPFTVCASPASIRHFHEELPSGGSGYYGNCLFPIIAVGPTDVIANAPLNEVIKMVRNAKEGLKSNYANSFRTDQQGPPRPPPEASYGDFAVVDWRQLGFYEADFGWGPPRFVHPLSAHTGSNAVAGIIKSPPPVAGVRVMSNCVKEEHCEAFEKELHKWE